MDIKRIANLGWSKRWAGPFSRLAASYWGKQYISTNKRGLGEGFHNILFTHKEGITTAYRGKEENIAFGEFLAKRAVENNGILNEWSDNLKLHTDRIRKIITEPTESFLNIQKYKEFEQAFEAYHPFQVSVNTVPDYLPPDLIK